MKKNSIITEYPWQWGFDAAIAGKAPEANPFNGMEQIQQNTQWCAGYESAQKLIARGVLAVSVPPVGGGA